MSFLPFVLSFLLLLVIGSSFLFTSFRSTSLEKTVILAQNRAKLGLISKQAEADYKKSQPKKEPKNQRPIKEKTNKPAIYKDERNQRDGLPSSKFNLWPLFNSTASSEYTTLQKSVVRLIKILYQDADFYKNARDPDLADKIVREIIAQKGEELSQFPQNVPPEIYYKMLKGSNTGYPALGEYFKIEKSVKAIQWPYAKTPILRAVLGDDATNRILAMEKAAWEENHHKKVLPKETLRELLLKHTNPDFDISLLETIFMFDNSNKDIPHIYIEDQNKVMARGGGGVNVGTKALRCIGMLKVNVVPWPSTEATETVPSCFSMMVFTIESPSPAPPRRRV